MSGYLDPDIAPEDNWSELIFSAHIYTIQKWLIILKINNLLRHAAL